MAINPRYFLLDSFSETGKRVVSSAISKYSNSNSACFFNSSSTYFVVSSEE